MSMETETNKMSSFTLILSLILLVVHHGVVTAIHAEKPMIYINFFDEIVSDNASSKLVEKAITTTLTPLTNNSKDDIRKKMYLSEEHLKLDNENKTSSPYYSIFDFDNPSKADITETAVNESDTDSYTTGRYDLVDPGMLEPDLSRTFFLKVMTNMIAHIMEALFSIDETSKLNESPNFDYESSAPSRKLKKRDLTESSIKSNEEGSTSENVQSVELKTELTSVDPVSESDISTGATLKHGNKNTATSGNISPEHLKLHDKFAKNLTENSSYTQSTTHSSGHDSINHGSHKVTNEKPEGNVAKSTAGVKNQQETDIHPEGKAVSNKKHFAQIDVPEKPRYANEDHRKMSHFNDDSSILNDEVVNKKDNHFYGGVHPAEYHDGYRFDENTIDEGDDYNDIKESSSLVTLLLISTTVMILMILVAFGLSAAYFFRKNQIQRGNSNASNLSPAVA